MSGARSAAQKLYLAALNRMPSSLALRVQFLRQLEYNPDFTRPTTFNELIQDRKLRVPDPELYARLADKVLVKEHVASLIGHRYLIPTLWAGTALPPREERGWPVPFVLKANHGSGWNHFVREPSDLRWEEIEALAERWLNSSWPRYLHESWYNRISRQLLVEPLIGEGPLNDFKFLVFGGRVHFVQVDSRRFTDHRRTFFDPSWVRQPFSLRFPSDPDDIAPPRHLQEMIGLAECLGAGFDFVRVDLYDLPQGPVFGELTFTPGAGCDPFNPPEHDLLLGKLWREGHRRGQAAVGTGKGTADR